MDVVYETSAFLRQRADLPELPIVNMLSEQAPTESQPVLQSRPGLEAAGLTVGSGPVRGLFQIDGVLSGALFSVSGNKLYSSTTNLGTIDGTGPVSFGGYEDMVFVNAGASVWFYDGVTLAADAFPDGADVLSICVGASRIIAVRKDTGELYWSDLLDEVIGGLNFATAESSPDRLKDLIFLGDTLVLLGSETVEFWPVSDDPDAPFKPLIGRVFPVGIRDTGCVTKLHSGFVWVTNNNQICMNDPENLISVPFIQEQLTDSTTARLWTFFLDGDEFLVVRLDTATWVYSLRSQAWTRMESYGQVNWLPQCYLHGYFGSSADGVLLQWSDAYTDLGGTLERRFRAWAPINNAGVTINNFTIRTNPGHTSYLTGTFANPSVELRTSRDAGRTWGLWRDRSLGVAGNYRAQTRWNSLGMFGYPGAMAEIRVTDPTPFRISGLTVNEPYGGV